MPLNMYMLGISIFLRCLEIIFYIRDIEVLNDTVKSHLSVDWMVTEWWLNGDWMVTGKVDFSHHSVIIQSNEWQAYFSDHSVRLFFWKIKCIWRATRLQPGMWESKEKYSNHSATRTVKYIDWHFVFVLLMCNYVLRTCFINFLQLS